MMTPDGKYGLLQEMPLLDALRACKVQPLPHIVIRPVTGSTNDDAKTAMQQGAGCIIVAAHKQDGGKGQRGRGFVSRPGGMYITIGRRLSMPADHAQLLTIAAGLSVYKTVKGLGLDCRIKYPNDVYVGGKKVCGILTETRCVGNLLEWAVTGIGLNVNNAIAPEIGHQAETLCALLGRPLNLTEITASVSGNFIKYGNILAQGIYDTLIQEYRETGFYTLTEAGLRICSPAALLPNGILKSQT